MRLTILSLVPILIAVSLLSLVLSKPNARRTFVTIFGAFVGMLLIGLIMFGATSNSHHGEYASHHSSSGYHIVHDRNKHFTVDQGARHISFHFVSDEEDGDKRDEVVAECDGDCDFFTDDCPDCEKGDQENFVADDESSDSPWREDPEWKAAIDATAEADDVPDWVSDDLRLDREPHRITITVGPYETWREVNRRTEADVRSGLREYADWYVRAADWSLPVNLGDAFFELPRSDLRRCMVDEHDALHDSQTPATDEWPMRYVLVEFDKPFRERVLSTYLARSQQIARSKRAGIWAGGVLSLIATAFGILTVRKGR